MYIYIGMLTLCLCAQQRFRSACASCLYWLLSVKYTGVPFVGSMPIVQLPIVLKKRSSASNQ